MYTYIYIQTYLNTYDTYKYIHMYDLYTAKTMMWLCLNINLPMLSPAPWQTRWARNLGRSMVKQAMKMDHGRSALHFDQGTVLLIMFDPYKII
jgi:hypothetical protein